jgi:hypothetical protein
MPKSAWSTIIWSFIGTLFLVWAFLDDSAQEAISGAFDGRIPQSEAWRDSAMARRVARQPGSLGDSITYYGCGDYDHGGPMVAAAAGRSPSP